MDYCLDWQRGQSAKANMLCRAWEVPYTALYHGSCLLWLSLSYTFNAGKSHGSESSSLVSECVPIFHCMSTHKESPFHLSDGNIASYQSGCRWYCCRTPRRSKIGAKFLMGVVQTHRCYLNCHRPIQCTSPLHSLTLAGSQIGQWLSESICLGRHGSLEQLFAQSMWKRSFESH